MLSYVNQISSPTCRDCVWLVLTIESPPRTSHPLSVFAPLSHSASLVKLLTQTFLHLQLSATVVTTVTVRQPMLIDVFD